MPEDEAQEFAGLDGLFVGHGDSFRVWSE
jgi:hypothetical protein